MRRADVVILLAITSVGRAADCVPLDQARAYVGEVKCVTGKVVRVTTNDQGTHFLDFCEDRAACPFSAVVFPADLRDVGDVRKLAGRVIEIRGPVKLYDGRAEIVLRRISQLSGGVAMIPPVPKTYDVENRGHYSAGRFRPGKKPRKTHVKPSLTGAYGSDVEGEESQE